MPDRSFARATVASVLAALAAAAGPAAHADDAIAKALRPIAPGDIVTEIELVAERTVYVEPVGQGSMRVVSVLDKNRWAPVPKVAGQLGLALGYNPENGTLLEFNSGLPYAFSYSIDLADVAGDGRLLRQASDGTCPVGAGLVSSQRWATRAPVVVFHGLAPFDGRIAC